MDIRNFLIFMTLFKINSFETVVEQANSLLLTTLDSIALIYPKEMNYENDFLHIIFKLNTNKTQHRIDDAVYDNKTLSIYFTLSNSSGSSELIRLKRRTNFASNRSVEIDSTEYQFEIASNWVFHPVYKTQNSKILSLDINSFKRKLYWFEFDIRTLNWYLTVAKLTGSLYFSPRNLHQILIDNKIPFSNDGYSYISIVRDNYLNDISLFVSNNESLTLCHLINMTCLDYFRWSFESTRPTTTRETTTRKFVDLGEEDYYDDVDRTTFPWTTTNPIDDPVYKFGKLMGLKYDVETNSLYLSDYLNDRIERVTFSNEFLKLGHTETILKSEYLSNSVSHVALNPIMSFLFDNYIYWIDYEDGLKTSLYKSSCFRSIYKVKDVVSLKLITLTLNINSNFQPNDILTKYLNSLIGHNGNDLIALKTLSSKYKYPPDYVYYYSYVINQNNGSSKIFDFDFQKNFTYKVKSSYFINFCFLLILFLM
ncbi:unnamed protein product [Brachionus calyciflorus]|uniref:Uncharacterized protein n=1 Tax=Brachionus calyciflorus TaxID=104777 RepID=A0A814GX39_9BILA|nr:unnamed protein product [Brachionus calyciflorus]